MVVMIRMFSVTLRVGSTRSRTCSGDGVLASHTSPGPAGLTHPGSGAGSSVAQLTATVALRHQAAASSGADRRGERWAGMDWRIGGALVMVLDELGWLRTGAEDRRGAGRSTRLLCDRRGRGAICSALSGSFSRRAVDSVAVNLGKDVGEAADTHALV